MTAPPHLYVVVPVLNEAAGIHRLMASFHALEAELGRDFALRFILVDDGSTDGTAVRARELSAGLDFEILTHAANRGPGAAFATAFEALAIRLTPSDWVLTLEGDNTSRLELVRQMLTRAREGFDVVLASPYLYGGGISHTSAYRVFLSLMANVFVREALGLGGIATISSFFRLYRGHVVLRLQGCYGPRVLQRCGFESMVELLLKLVYMNCSISEVAMWLDLSQRAGRSKMSVARTIAGYLAAWKMTGHWRRQCEVWRSTAPPSASGSLATPAGAVAVADREHLTASTNGHP